MTTTMKKQTKPTKPTKATTKNNTQRAQPIRKPAKAKKPPTLVPGPGEIVVTNGHGPTLIKAETLHDFFAIHPPLDGPKKGHALTHVPSGRRIATYRTRALAVWVAARLRAFGGAELWAFTDPNHLAKHAAKDVLAQLRRLADPMSAEQDMREAQDPGGVRIAAKATAAPKATPPPATAPPVTQYSAPWRNGIDWVAAGKKAYETRLRNLAAKQAAQQPPAPVKARRAGARS
jgi:hypothetical protein